MRDEIDLGSVAPYTDSVEHLWDELRRMDQYVRAQTSCWLQMIARTKPEKFWGLVHVSEEEVRAYLSAPYLYPQALPEDIRGVMAPYLKEAGKIKDEIRARREAGAADQVLRLDVLQAFFGLSDAERDILLLALLPELDARYRRLYGFLMDDASQTSPTIELLLNILFPDSAAFGRSLFDVKRPLMEYQLLDLSSPQVEGEPWQLNHVRVDSRIANFLLGSDRIDSRLAEIISLAGSASDLTDQFLGQPLLDRLALLTKWWSSAREQGEEMEGGVIFFSGPYGSPHLAAAQALCTTSNTRLLVISVKDGLQTPLNWTQLVTLVYREAALQDAAVFWEGAGLLRARDTEHTDWDHLVRAAEAYIGLSFIASETAWEPEGLLYQKPFFSLEFPIPDYPQRLQIWQSLLKQKNDEQDSATVELLANNFLFTPGQILDAFNSATALAMLRDPSNDTPRPDELFEGCRRQSNRKLISFASRIEPRPDLSFDQVVLPPPNKQQLFELRDRIRLKSKVYSELGFEQRLFLGKGLIALFAGSSGTGKTLAASVLAGKLQLDLYKVDLSAVISKYVGETEKNLKQIFSDASGSNAILFFDEADALFGKRAEVEKAQDRWANAEINSLLSQLEEYNGVVILASNLSQNIDEAFTRRFHVIVEFPFPDREDRLEILEALFPDGIERPSAEELEVIANFKLSGGNLKNVVLHGAFLARAAQKEKPIITLRHLIDATAREYQKMGMPLKKSEFSEEYYAWVVEDILSGPADKVVQPLP